MKRQIFLSSCQKFFFIYILFLLVGCVSEQAIPVAKKTYNPKASAYNVQLGLAYLQQGNRQRAKQKLLSAIAENPNSATANDALAYYYEKTQDFKQADEYYQQAVKINPQAGAALNNYGAFLCRQKKYSEANEYFFKAVSDVQYINTALAYENAGLCAVAAQQPEQAKYYFKQALAQDPSLRQSTDELKKLD